MRAKPPTPPGPTQMRCAYASVAARDDRERGRQHDAPTKSESCEARSDPQRRALPTTSRMMTQPSCRRGKCGVAERELEGRQAGVRRDDRQGRRPGRWSVVARGRGSSDVSRHVDRVACRPTASRRPRHRAPAPCGAARCHDRLHATGLRSPASTLLSTANVFVVPLLVARTTPVAERSSQPLGCPNERGRFVGRAPLGRLGHHAS